MIFKLKMQMPDDNFFFFFLLPFFFLELASHTLVSRLSEQIAT